jgi:hypothetical protein
MKIIVSQTFYVLRNARQKIVKGHLAGVVQSLGFFVSGGVKGADAGWTCPVSTDSLEILDL